MWTPEGDLEKLPNVDVGVAVAIEGGLITPIIRNTNALSIVEISSQIRVSEYYLYFFGGPLLSF